MRESSSLARGNPNWKISVVTTSNREFSYSALGSISFSQSVGLCWGHHLHGPSLSKKVFVFSVRRILLIATEEAQVLASYLGIYAYISCWIILFPNEPYSLIQPHCAFHQPSILVPCRVFPRNQSVCLGCKLGLGCTSDHLAEPGRTRADFFLLTFVWLPQNNPN